MAELIVSPDAEQDLLEIWLYIAEDQVANADRFIDRLYQAATRLTEFNEMGVVRPELATGLRSFPVEHYVLYYRAGITASNWSGFCTHHGILRFYFNVSRIHPTNAVKAVIGITTMPAVMVRKYTPMC